MPTQEERNEIEAGIPDNWDADRLARETYVTTVATEKRVVCIDREKLPALNKRLSAVEGEQKRIKRSMGAVGRRVRLQGELNGKPSQSRPKNTVRHGPNGKPVVNNGRRLTTGSTTVDVTLVVVAFFTFLGICVQVAGG